MGDWWTPIVMRSAFFGCKRFEQFQETLGVSRATLTARLTRLVDEGYLSRTAYQSAPVRYEYRPTEKGRAFFDVLAAMWRFGEDWLFVGGDAPPLQLARRDTRAPVAPLVVDEHTGTRLDVREIRAQRRR